MGKNQKGNGASPKSGMKPFARYQVEWNQTVPRKGSAFERMAVYTIDRLSDTELAGDSLRNVFVNILKVPDETVTLFLKPALEDLMDSGLGAIRHEFDGRSPENSPLRSLTLTEVGRKLLREGSLQCPPQTRRKAVLVNLDDGTICGDRNGLKPMDEVAEGRYSPLAYFPQEKVEQYVRNNEIVEGNVSDLRSLSKPEFFFGYANGKGKKKDKNGRN